MQPVPLFGAGVYAKSAVVTRQRRVNCYYENRADGDKAKIVIYGTPGLVKVFSVGSPLNTPVRAILGPTNSSLYAVVSNEFQSIAPPATVGAPASVLFSGFIGTSQGLASLAANPNVSQILIVDGSSGWVFNTQAQTLTQLGAGAAWFTPGARTCTNIGGYFVTEVPGTGQFAASNINDATTGYALSIATAAAYPDIMVAVDNNAGNLILFAQQHLEFWQPVGTPPPAQPFQLIQSSPIRWGLAAPFARVEADTALFFLGQTKAGTRRVCRIDGYTVTPVSAEIDYILNQPGFVYADATMLSYQRDVHAFVQLTFPTMNRSFLYDCASGIWSETQTGLSTGPYVRHTANISTYYNGDTLLCDYQNGFVYRMDDNTYADNGTPVLREVVTKHQTRGYNRFRIPQLYLDMETGVGLSGNSAAPVQGQAPVISIECSKDNGRTWLQARLLPVGAQGQFVTRVNARRFGMSRVFTFRIRMTDPVKFVITDGAIRRKGKPETPG
jgi:hypothetical protein